jgi:hypothetical protein
MDLTPDEAFCLLSMYRDGTVPNVGNIVIDSLFTKGMIYASNEENLQLTYKGKVRVGNHILKERNLPDYINKYSFPEAFNKFFVTATPNAVNALLISLVNAKKLVGVHAVTLNRLADDIATEQDRQKTPNTKLIINGKG